MLQHYLDPNATAGVNNVWTPPGPIPEKVRSFGFYPDIDSLLPGDLILVRNLKPNFTHEVIEWVQKMGGYHVDDAMWHHAAVYLGYGGDICEADIGGVIHSSMDRYSTGRHLIRVRRDNELTDDQRWRIAIRSLTRLKESYDFGQLLDIFFVARAGFHKGTSNN